MKNSKLAHANWMLASAIQNISCAMSVTDTADQIEWIVMAKNAINEAFETIDKELPF